MCSLVSSMGISPSNVKLTSGYDWVLYGQKTKPFVRPSRFYGKYL